MYSFNSERTADYFPAIPSGVSEESLHLPHKGFIHLVLSLHVRLRHSTHLCWADHLSSCCLLFLYLTPSHAFIYPPSTSTTQCLLQRPSCSSRYCSTFVPTHSECRWHKPGDLRLGIDNLRLGRDGGPTSTSTCCQTPPCSCNRSDVGSFFDGGMVVASRVAAWIGGCGGGSCPWGRRHLHDTWSHRHGHGWGRQVAL